MLETDTLNLQLSNRDLVITNGSLQLSSGVSGVVQLAEARLEMLLGEWFLDTELGIPYLQKILKKNPNIPEIRVILRAALLDLPGVTSVDKLQVDFTATSRTASVTFEASIVFDDTPTTITVEI